MVPPRAAVPAVALLVVLAGCSVLPGSQPPSDERALDALNRTTAAVEEVPTYRFAIDARVAASDGDRSRTVHVAGEGTVDRPARRMVSNATAEGETRAQYVDGRTTYTECPDPWDGWGVENASGSAEWFEATPLGRQLALLEATDVYWGGNETLDGDRTWRIVAHPSKRALDELSTTGRTGVGDLARANVQNATLELWVDAETGLPVKSEFVVELSTRGASATAELTTRFHRYDEPATVSLPRSTRTDQYELGCPGG